VKRVLASGFTRNCTKKRFKKEQVSYTTSCSTEFYVVEGDFNVGQRINFGAHLWDSARKSRTPTNDLYEELHGLILHEWRSHYELAQPRSLVDGGGGRSDSSNDDTPPVAPALRQLPPRQHQVLLTFSRTAARVRSWRSTAAPPAATPRLRLRTSPR
jgi:hypothetical protein